MAIQQQLYTLYSLHCVQVPHMLLTVEGDPTSARVIHATLGCAGRGGVGALQTLITICLSPLKKQILLSEYLDPCP